jgi:LysM repeat protein
MTRLKQIIFISLTFYLTSCVSNKKHLRPEVRLLGPIEYVRVKRTDTIKSLARKSKMSIKNFKQLNGLRKRQDVQSKSTVMVGISRFPEGLNRRKFKKIANKYRKKIRNCYGRLIKLNPKKEGSLLLQIEINDTGSVNSVTYNHSSIKNIELESCVASEVSGWKFPLLPEGSTVSLQYPILFQANFKKSSKRKK